MNLHSKYHSHVWLKINLRKRYEKGRQTRLNVAYKWFCAINFLPIEQAIMLQVQKNLTDNMAGIHWNIEREKENSPIIYGQISVGRNSIKILYTHGFFHGKINHVTLLK